MAMPVSIAVMTILPLVLTSTVQTVIQSMVPMLDTLSRDPRMSLGASLRDRATLPSPLRGLGPSGGYPSRLRSLTLTPRSAWRGGSLRSPPLPGRRARGEVRPHRPPDRRGLLAPALRAALVGVLASLALAGCAGCGHRLGSVPGCTPCLAGAGFALHRLRHCAGHDPPHGCLRSCARSCGALPHFAPHRAGHSCSHDCGHRRHRLRQRAAHVCLRLRPHRPPLIRRGGSPPPGSPASIPRTLMLPIRPSRTAGAASVSTPDASRCGAGHAGLSRALSGACGIKRDRAVVGPSVYIGRRWRRRANLLNSRDVFGAGLPMCTRRGPMYTGGWRMYTSGSALHRAPDRPGLSSVAALWTCR